MKTTVGLHGSYFSRNFGDTLILSIIRNWIGESEVEVVLPFVGSSQEATEILGEVPSAKKEIRELDGLIFGPGGYFGEPPGNLFQRARWSLRNYRRHIRWNRKLYKDKIPYIIIGVGVGPISFFLLRKRIVKLFQNARYVTVRDDYSKAYLIKWGIVADKILVTRDVALTLTPDRLPNEKNAKPKIALHFPGMDLEGEGKVGDFVEFISYLQKRNEVLLLEDVQNQFNSSRKENLNNVLKRNNLDLGIIKYETPTALINNLQKVDLIITSKLHVGIVGYALGKRILSIPKHTKTIRFFEQIDRKEFCIPFTNINLDLLIEKYERLIHIDNSRNILHEDAIRNKEIVSKFINEI